VTALALRRFIAGMAACVILLAPAAGHACDQPRQMDGFKTCADVTKAEQEGAVVVYSTEPESLVEQFLGRFHAMFPKIAPTYVGMQGGALYAKLLTERRAHAYVADILQPADMGFALDFQKRGGYLNYISPEMSVYPPQYKSSPEGNWTLGALVIAGIAYNSSTVAATEAPTSWQDALNPKWSDAISVKDSNSGLQHVTWYELRKIYGDAFWQKLSPLKPRALDSNVQQYDRVVSGQDKVTLTAALAGYLHYKAKGAPIAFVYPSEGVTAAPQPWGIVADAPHPAAAQLFMDWFLGVPGQTADVQVLYNNSLRPDVPPPPGGVKADTLKLLLPTDWNDFQATHPQFVREWDKITGLR
jgi:iron(III) transport system substrate-binding protein